MLIIFWFPCYVATEALLLTRNFAVIQLFQDETDLGLQRKI